MIKNFKPNITGVAAVSITLATLSSLYSVPAVSAQTVGPVEKISRYDRCLKFARSAPDKGINLALVWQQEGGGVPARHCEAVGLFGLKEYAEAAYRLSKMAEDMRVGRDMPVVDGSRQVADQTMLADIYGQAAGAWLLADMLGRAIEDIDKAVALAEKDSLQYRSLLLDRARINAADGDYERAYKDMQDLLIKDPKRSEYLIFYASAARLTGRVAEAKSAIDTLLGQDPNHVEGLLEKGNLLDAIGDIAGARQAWLRLLRHTEVGVSADAARENLARTSLSSKPSTATDQ